MKLIELDTLKVRSFVTAVGHDYAKVLGGSSVTLQIQHGCLESFVQSMQYCDTPKS